MNAITISNAFRTKDTIPALSILQAVVSIICPKKLAPYKYKISLSVSDTCYSSEKKTCNMLTLINLESCLTFYEIYVKSSSNDDKHC